MNFLTSQTHELMIRLGASIIISNSHVMSLEIFTCLIVTGKDVPVKANNSGIGLDYDVRIQLPCPTKSALCWCCQSTHNCFLYGEDKETCEVVSYLNPVSKSG